MCEREFALYRPGSLSSALSGGGRGCHSGQVVCPVSLWALPHAGPWLAGPVQFFQGPSLALPGAPVRKWFRSLAAQGSRWSEWWCGSGLAGRLANEERWTRALGDGLAAAQEMDNFLLGRSLRSPDRMAGCTTLPLTKFPLEIVLDQLVGLHAHVISAAVVRLTISNFSKLELASIA